MNKKLTTQALTELLAQEAGINKRAADTFVKAFIQTVIEGGIKDGNVKIKGLGTFKVTQVADRESADVNTGKRIVIAGYQKMSFSSEINLDNENSEEKTDKTEIKLNNELQNSDNKKTIRQRKTKAKLPTDKNSTITTTSATPTIEDKAEVVVKQTTSTVEDKAEAVVEQTTSTIEDKTEVVVEQTTSTIEDKAEEITEKVVFKSNAPKYKLSKKTWIVGGIAVAIILICIIFAIPKNEPIDNQKQQITTNTQEVESKDSIVASNNKEKENAPQKPKIHILQKGESLTTISVLYYHTKDSMGAIWKLNKFKNPNDIPLGTEIKLP